MNLFSSRHYLYILYMSNICLSAYYCHRNLLCSDTIANRLVSRCCWTAAVQNSRKLLVENYTDDSTLLYFFSFSCLPLCFPLTRACFILISLFSASMYTCTCAILRVQFYVCNSSCICVRRVACSSTPLRCHRGVTTTTMRPLHAPPANVAPYSAFTQ